MEILDEEFIFSYGTLRDPEVQKKIIGRTITGKADLLKGFSKSTIQLSGKAYPIIAADQKGIIKGMILRVTSEELKKIDKYETTAYRRAKVILESGKEAWVYQKREKKKTKWEIKFPKPRLKSYIICFLSIASSCL